MKLVTFGAAVAISVNVTPSVERLILNPVSLPLLSDQVRSMRLEDAVNAARLLGAGSTKVAAVTWLEGGPSPAASDPTTR